MASAVTARLFACPVFEVMRITKSPLHLTLLVWKFLFACFVSSHAINKILEFVLDPHKEHLQFFRLLEAPRHREIDKKIMTLTFIEQLAFILKYLALFSLSQLGFVGVYFCMIVQTVEILIYFLALRKEYLSTFFVKFVDIGLEMLFSYLFTLNAVENQSLSSFLNVLYVASNLMKLILSFYKWLVVHRLNKQFEFRVSKIKPYRINKDENTLNVKLKDNWNDMVNKYKKDEQVKKYRKQFKEKLDDEFWGRLQVLKREGKIEDKGFWIYQRNNSRKASRKKLLEEVLADFQKEKLDRALTGRRLASEVSNNQSLGFGNEELDNLNVTSNEKSKSILLGVPKSTRIVCKCKFKRKIDKNTNIEHNH